MALPPIDHLCERYENLKTVRRNFESQWRTIQELVRPLSPELSATAGGDYGRRKNDRIYDGTAMWANETLAGGLHAYLTSPTDRWFAFSMKHKDAAKLTLTERKQLEASADTLYHYFAMQKVGFNPAAHELYLDLCAFGTAIMYSFWHQKSQCIRFKTYPIVDCYIDENEDNQIDSVFRDTRMGLRQIQQAFPDAKLPKEMLNAHNTTTKYTVVHGVFPRGERNLKSFDPKNKPYTSVYFIPQEKVILQEGGFDSFPYIVPRWSKLPGEIYGRSPAMTCLPDTQMINRMMKEVIIAAQLSNRPPIVYEEDSLFLPISYLPGSLIAKTAGTEFPQPLNQGISTQLTYDMMMQAREHITRAFYVDFLKNDFKKERQTAYEIADRRDEKLMMLSPILSRLESEFLSPLIDRSVVLLREHTEYGKSDPVIANSDRIKTFYISTAARAQLSGKAVQIARAIEEIVPLANIFPEVLDKFHPGRLVEELTKLRSVSPTILRTEQEMDELAEQRQEQQQAQMEMEGAPAMASSMKDMAQAENLMSQADAI